MVVRVGPVPSTSVLAWVAYARQVLGAADDGAHDLPDLDDEVVAELRAHLDEWEELARRDDELIWVADVEPERVEFLVHAFHRVAEALAAAAERRGRSSAPAGADAFYKALVTGVLDALATEDRSTAEMSDMLRTSWPGIEPD